MSLYEYAYRLFQGRHDVPNMFSLRPKNSVELCEDGIPFGELLKRACYIETRTSQAFLNAYKDSCEDTLFDGCICEKLSEGLFKHNNVIYNDIKKQVTHFQGMCEYLREHPNSEDYYSIGKEICKLYEELEEKSKIVTDIPSSVLLGDFLEYFRGYVIRLKNENKVVSL